MTIHSVYLSYMMYIDMHVCIHCFMASASELARFSAFQAAMRCLRAGLGIKSSAHSASLRCKRMLIRQSRIAVLSA